MTAIRLAVLSIIVICSGAAASAATFNWSYDLGVSTLTGVLTGELQADGNTIHVTDIDKTALDGVEYGPTITTLSSFRGTPYVTLDGSRIDLYSVNASYSRGFVLISDLNWVRYSVPGTSTIRIGSTRFSSNFSIEEMAAVPLPATGLLFLSSLAGLAMIRRGRRKTV